MKHRKPMLCMLLLFSLLIGLLSSCSNNAASTSEQLSNTSSTNTSIPPAVTEFNSTESSLDSTNASANENNMESPTYPLVTDSSSLDYFISFDSNWGEYVENWASHPAFLLAEEITGVHIDFIEISASAYNTQFNLMVASGDYPDLIDSFATNYTSGIDNAIDEGIIIDLAEYMEEFAPNYCALLDKNPAAAKDTRTDSGAVGSLYNLKQGSTGPMIGAFTRQDWLDEQGLSSPETYEEYENMLRTFKDAYDCSSPLYITKSGIPNDDWLATGYGVKLGGGTSGPWYVEGGVVKCGYLESGFTDYITMMQNWYLDGLLSSDFVSVEDTTFAPDAAATIQEGNAAVWYSFYRQDNSWADNSTDPDFEAVAIADATRNEGDIIPFGNSDSIVDRAGTSISTTCQSPELAIQWLDFWYSEQGIIISNYGVEGVSYTLNENGEPELTELITNNPDGASQTAMMYAYTLQIPSYYDTNRTLLVDYGDRTTWGSNRTSDNDYPTNVTMTVDEGYTFSSTFSDIETYAEEMFVKFIIGEEPLEEIGTFQENLRSMGIDICLEIKQAAYDRYMQR